MAGISLSFRGQTWTIPENRAFEAGAAVEEVVSLSEMAQWGAQPKFFKLARAFGTLLRFAGAKCSDAEVKAEIDASILRAIDTGRDKDAATEMFAVAAMAQLQAVLFTGAPDGGGDKPPGKTSALSRRRSRSP